MPTTLEIIRIIIAIPAGVFVGWAFASMAVQLVKAIRGSVELD